MQNFLYDAFISYRHTPQDTKTAETIQYELEHYRIPKGVRSAYGIKKINRIFRDQAELQMSSDLSREIERALDASRFLIVICSEAYNQSPWCLHEVEYFLKHHNPERVLCVLSQGEPPGIFPAQLRAQKYPVRNPDGSTSYLTVGSEPLACDFRTDSKHARRTELPRLAAKIIGCSYDDLVMRRETYRKRRLALILSLSAAAAAVAMSYLVWSNVRITRNYRQSQINESRTLARESINAFEDHDRRSALQLALDALPGQGGQRPVTDDALNALIRASYAYKTPQESFTEFWRIDLPNDISACFITGDRTYAVCMDSAGQVFVTDIRSHEQISAFFLSQSGVPSAIEEYTDHSLLTYIDGVSYCYDYLTGEMRWSSGMMYDTSVGAVHPSHNGLYTATANKFAVLITDQSGGPYLALPVPNSVSGSILDTVWSTNDRYLAVQILMESGSYQMGLFDFDTSDFVLLPEVYSAVNGCFFDKDDHLYVLGNAIELPSMDAGDTAFYIEGTYTLTGYNWKRKLFQKDFVSSAMPDHTHLYGQFLDDRIIVATGSDLMLLDGSGKLLREYDTVVPVRGMLDCNDQYIELISQEGTLIRLFLSDGSLTLKKEFPSGITAGWAVPVSENTEEGLGYAFLTGGDLSFCKDLYDEQIRYYDSITMDFSLADVCYGKNTIAIQSSRTLSFIDRQKRSLIRTLDLDSGDAYHLIDQIDEIMYVLHIDVKTKRLSVISFDLDSASLIDETPLDLIDPTLSLRDYSYPLDQINAYYIESTYKTPSFVSQRGQFLYLHDLQQNDRILIYDLVTREQKSLTVHLEDSSTLISNKTLLPSPLYPSPDGDYIFTIQTKELVGPEGEAVYETEGILIDTEKGAVTPVTQNVLSGVISGDLAAWNGAEVLVVERNVIAAYNKKGEKLYEIPLSGNSVLALSCHNGNSYCIYKNGHMAICRKDKVLRDVALELQRIDLLDAKALQFLFDEEMLYLLHYNGLNAVRLDSDSSMPVYSLNDRVLAVLCDTNELLIYAESPYYDSFDYLAAFTEYDTDALIRRAQEQLNQY